MTDEKQKPMADPIKQRAAEIVAQCPIFLSDNHVHVKHVQNAVERALREGMAMHERDAARYRLLRGRARQETALDLFGYGGQWCIYLHSKDSQLNLDAAIDAAMLARNGE